MKTCSATQLREFSGIDWSPHSFEDPGGRIFFNDGRLYRAIRGRTSDAFRQLEEKNLLAASQNWGLVRTTKSDFALPDFDFIVEHEVIPPSPLVSEWSPAMLLDSANLYCDLSLHLAEHGLQLQDSHGWNIMFNRTQPVYVDFGSIVPLGEKEPWMPLYEFINCFLHPLEMIAHGQTDLAFFLLGTKNWISLEETIPNLFNWQVRLMKAFRNRKYNQWERIRRIGGSGAARRLLEILKSHLSKLSAPRNKTRWNSYSDGFAIPDESEIAGWNQKQKSVHQILSSLDKGRLLDLACNAGWYSVLAAKMGFDVISMDTDRSCIDSLYKTGSQSRLSITPVAASPFWPTIAHGPRFYSDLKERFQADHTLMLALIHHLFFKQGYSVSAIVAIASNLTRKTLVLEFVPPDDYWIEAWNVHHRQEDYGLEVWMSELGKEFSDISVLPSEFSHPSSQVQRSLIVARR